MAAGRERKTAFRSRLLRIDRSRGVMSLVAIHWEEVRNLSFDMLGLCCHIMLAIRILALWASNLPY